MDILTSLENLVMLIGGLAAVAYAIDWFCIKVYGWKKGPPPDKSAQEEEPLE